MNKIFAIPFISIIYITNVYAVDACEVLNPRAKISEKIETDVKGSATILFKLGAIDGDVKVSIEKETINIYDKHKDANKALIKGKLIYLYCNVIQGSESLSDLQKLNAIRKLYIENDDLDMPEDSSTLLQYSGVEYKMKSCTQKSKSINCKFTVKNTGKDKQVQLNANSFIIDSEGDKYTVSNIKFGKITNTSFPSKLLVKDIFVRTEISVVVIFQILQMQTSQKQKPIAYL
jgi:hypothetical protein